MTVKVSKISIDLGNGEHIELTMEQAEEMHRQLNELFGEKTGYFTVPPGDLERLFWHLPDVTSTGSTFVSTSRTGAF